MECRFEINDIVPVELLVANYSRTAKFFCTKCEYTFPIDTLERHLTGINRCSERSGEVKVLCPVESCKYHHPKFFRKLKHLRTHYQHCHAPREFDCLNCGVFFRDEVALRSHQRTCGRLRCETCPKNFKNAQGAERHIKRYVGHKLAQESLDIIKKIKRKPKKKIEKIPSLTIIRFVPLKNRPLMPEGEKSTNTAPVRPCTDASVQTDDAIVLDTACVAISTQTSFLKTIEQNNQTGSDPIQHVDWGGTAQLETNTFGCQTFDDSFLTDTVLTQTEPFYGEVN